MFCTEEIKPATGAVYRPSSKLMKTAESKSESKLPPPFLPTTPSPAVKPVLGDVSYNIHALILACVHVHAW